MNNNVYAWIDESLQTIYKANWYRSVTALSGLPDRYVKINDRQLLNFASNNYLGLAGDQRLIEAAVTASKNFGTGTTGSRLVTGHRSLHQELEEKISKLKGTESSLVFSSGYLANLGVIAALVSNRDLILSDRYNHSSLKKGAILSEAVVIEYAHNNMLDLREKLNNFRHAYRRCLIITDTVFSMDGDLCPLKDIMVLAEEFNSMLLVDEAHATGIFGVNGAGLVEHCGLSGKSIVQVGTLSKSIGSLGGYVAGSSQLIDYLKNRCPTWIYTTALSPADVAAAIAGCDIIMTDRDRRQKLWHNINYLHQKLRDFLPNLSIIPTNSAIVCLELPNPQRALELAQKLNYAGIFAPAIRPPTVPTSRIRLSLMSIHILEDLDYLVQVLSTIFN